MEELSKLPDPRNSPDEMLPAVPGSSLMTDEEVDGAAREAGLLVLSARTVRALKKLGEFVDQVGLVHIQVGKILETEERLRKLADEAQACVEEAEDLEVRLNAIRAAKEVNVEVLKAAEIAVKIVEEKMVSPKGSTGERRLRSFAPGEQVGPAVQVNIKTENATVQAKEA